MFKPEFLIVAFFILKNCAFSYSNVRLKRSLIYPPTAPTRLQFIGGIGIPVENLLFESITSGYVLKAEYFIPTKAEELHLDYLKPQTIHRRSAENNATQEVRSFQRKSRYFSQRNDLSRFRWTIYKGFEEIVNKMGLIGRPCMLQAICEVAETPFHYESGLLSELFHIVMTPSTSVDKITSHLDNEYFHAEMLGRSGAPCSKIFRECKRSILTEISTMYDVFF